MKHIFTNLVCFLILIFGLGAQQLIINEDFTDSLFDGTGAGIDAVNWKHNPFSNGVGMHKPNNRTFPYGLSKILSQCSSNPWAGAIRWGAFVNPDSGWTSRNLQTYYVDKFNDVVVIKYKSFSDVARKPEVYHAQITLMNYNEKFLPAPHFDHDISIETDNFYHVDNTSTPRQLNGNVNTIRNWAPLGIAYAHFSANGGQPTNTELSKEWNNLVIFRPKPNMYSTNIEQWGERMSDDYDVAIGMENRLFSQPPRDVLLDTISEYTKFNYVQFTFFSYLQTSLPFLCRTGVATTDAQIGFCNAQVGITKKSDFNIDYVIDQKDADTLVKYWGYTGTMKIRTGDATNDKASDLADANPLIAFWSAALDSGKASVTYNSSTGEIRITAQNISYFKIESASSSLNATAANFAALSPAGIVNTTTYKGCFSKIANTLTDYSLGTIAATGLNPSDLVVTINYFGSKVANGFKVPVNMGYNNTKPATIQFEISNVNLTEGVDTSYDFNVQLVNPDKVSTYVVRIATMAGDSLRTTLFGSKTLTFTPGGATSKIVHFSVIDDNKTTAIDNVRFGIQIVSGGNISKGNQNQLDLYIYDKTLSGKANVLQTTLRSSEVTIAPNPTDGLVSITSGDPIECVSIVNMLGTEIEIQSKNKKNIDISNYPKGVYILVIRTKMGEVKQKIIKK